MSTSIIPFFRILELVFLHDYYFSIVLPVLAFILASVEVVEYLLIES